MALNEDVKSKEEFSERQKRNVFEEITNGEKMAEEFAKGSNNNIDDGSNKEEDMDEGNNEGHDRIQSGDINDDMQYVNDVTGMEVFS